MPPSFRTGDPPRVAQRPEDAAMRITFIGGPWHGEARDRPSPAPDRIDTGGATTYVPWRVHPATAGIRAEPLADACVYVAADIDTHDLLKHVEDLLLHPSCDGIAMPRPGTAPFDTPPDSARRP